MDHLLITPLLRAGQIDPNHQVEVVAHDRVSTHIDSKRSALLRDSIQHPLFTVLEILTGGGIGTAEKRSPHAA